MKPTYGKIIVSVELNQKKDIVLNGVTLRNPIDFAVNYRERSPTIAVVVDGNEYVREGDMLITHHNLFQMPSPYHLYDDLFSVPFSKVMFAKVDTDGTIHPICGNIICSKILVETLLPVPTDQKKYHINKYIVEDGGWTMFKKGDMVLTRPHSGYDIIYFINGVHYQCTKVDSDMVCGVVKNRYISNV